MVHKFYRDRFMTIFFHPNVREVSQCHLEKGSVTVRLRTMMSQIRDIQLRKIPHPIKLGDFVEIDSQTEELRGLTSTANRAYIVEGIQLTHP